MKLFMKVYHVFLDRLFGFVYEWLWLAAAELCGMFVLEIYLPGMMEYVSPLASRWFVTVVLSAALLTFIRQAVEPLVALFFENPRLEPDDFEEDDEAEGVVEAAEQAAQGVAQ